MLKQIVFIVFVLILPTQFVHAADSATNRADSSFGIDAGYTFLSLPLPGSKNIMAFYNLNANWQVGFEYAWTTLGLTAFSFEIGEIEEYNRTIKARYFPTNSFNWIFGYGRRDTKVKLPGSLFDLVTHDYNNVLTRTRTEYAQVGFGSQWQWSKGYALTVDWFTLNIPVKAETTTSADRYTDNESDAREVRRMEGVVAWYPQMWLLQFKVGFVF